MIKTTIKKLDKSEVEIIGVLEVTEFEKYEEKALERIGERTELQGFRKGKAPASIVKENVFFGGCQHTDGNYFCSLVVFHHQFCCAN